MLQAISDGGTTILVVDHKGENDTTLIQEIVLDKPHVACDRIDVIFYSIEGGKPSVGAVKGQTSDDGPGVMFPTPPSIPKATKALASIRLRAGCDSIGDFDIENHDDAVTGEIPAVQFRDPPTQAIEVAAIEQRSFDPHEVVSDIILDPFDPLEARIIEMVEIHRRKRADYASEANPYQNFDRNAAALGIEGYGPLEDALSMINRKIGRIINLRGRDPRNESVLDSWLDLAVYSLLGYGIAVRDAKELGGTSK